MYVCNTSHRKIVSFTGLKGVRKTSRTTGIHPKPSRRKLYAEITQSSESLKMQKHVSCGLSRKKTHGKVSTLLQQQGMYSLVNYGIQIYLQKYFDVIKLRNQTEDEENCNINNSIRIAYLLYSLKQTNVSGIKLSSFICALLSVMFSNVQIFYVGTRMWWQGFFTNLFRV